ncbi:MAG: 50S ribosomal protein L18 [Candidatus Dadabacteria bacterium]|nr:MAG: 50S ribosomal protein L18 [Candidatus Dadabacteria bacterium]
MNRLEAKRRARLARKKRVRKKIRGTPERPRLTVYKSLKHIYAQIIDDSTGRTLVAASTVARDLRGDLKSTGNLEAARAVGLAIGRKALARDITRVVFDRNGYLYHGKVKALAEAAREAGLQF